MIKFTFFVKYSIWFASVFSETMSAQLASKVRRAWDVRAWDVLTVGSHLHLPRWGAGIKNPKFPTGKPTKEAMLLLAELFARVGIVFFGSYRLGDAFWRRSYVPSLAAQTGATCWAGAATRERSARLYAFRFSRQFQALTATSTRDLHCWRLVDGSVAHIYFVSQSFPWCSWWTNQLIRPSPSQGYFIAHVQTTLAGDTSPAKLRRYIILGNPNNRYQKFEVYRVIQRYSDIYYIIYILHHLWPALELLLKPRKSWEKMRITPSNTHKKSFKHIVNRISLPWNHYCCPRNVVL